MEHFAQHLIESTRHVFDRMLHIDVWADEPEPRHEPNPTYDVSAMIAVAGELDGFVVLSLPFDTARRVASVFAGSDKPLSDDDLADALGEIVSIIAGGAKPRLENKHINLGFPSVAIDAAPINYRHDDFHPIAIPFTCDCGEFTVEYALHAAAHA
jgi:CheY-specific phosphatase CheX